MIDEKIFFYTSSPMPISSVQRSISLDRKTIRQNTSFAEKLLEAQNKVRFSKHALERLQSRNISINDKDLEKLDDTVEKMAKKGARESLIYLHDMAFVVSVANRTVITAMDAKNAKENIFMNIDSAAIL